MMKINRLRLEIKGVDIRNDSRESTYGFDIEFDNGLNIIKGENTSGKSTIISSLIYSLGLEEILGAKYNKSLDKSLKTTFNFDGHEIAVVSSFVLVEIIGAKREIYTLKRAIKGTDNEKFLMRLYRSKISSIEQIEPTTLFIHRKRNHESELGYFKWFSNFIGLEQLPKVSNYDGDYTRLYLQTLFPALIIEQTKGWSELLASMPYFKVKDNKQRVIEYLLKLKALYNEVEKLKLEAVKRKLNHEWQIISKEFGLLMESNLGKKMELPEEPFSKESYVKEIRCKLKYDLKSKEYFEIDQLIEDYNARLIAKKQGRGNYQKDKPELRRRLSVLKEEYKLARAYNNEFLEKFEYEKNQLINYKKHHQELLEEIEINKDIKYLTEKDPNVNELKVCPTCNQEFGSNMIDSDYSVEFKTIKGNLAYLEDQEKLLRNSINSLTSVLNEKRVINKSFDEELVRLQSKVNQAENELIDPDKIPSRLQIYEEIEVENRIKELQLIKLKFEEIVVALKEIIKKNIANDREIKNLNTDLEDDKNKLDQLEADYKTLLYKFEYDSNEKYSVQLQRKFPFKYFPVSKYGDDIQKIQLSSSASDFIRSIWAYSISLMKNSTNHPGFLIFDEPSQHSMKSSSLIKLFKQLSKLSDKQIIVAASTEEHKKTEDKNPYSIDKILDEIKHKEYRIIDKSISLIKG